MERHFILPATLAAALHAGLLFGVHGSRAEIVRHNPPPKPPSGCELPLLDPFTPPEERSSKESAAPAQGIASEASVTLEERVTAPAAEDFVFQKVKAEPGTNIDPGKIAVGPPGILDGIGPIGPTAFSYKELDGAPRARMQARPVYPPEARQNGLMGEVLVEFTVDETGVVVDAHAVRSSERMFEESAVRAVARWRFEPGLRGNRPVRFRMAVPIVFRLDES